MPSSTTLLAILFAFALGTGYVTHTATTQEPNRATPITTPPTTGNDHEAGYRLSGVGWTAIDTTVPEHTDLRFRLTHDTIDDLCMTSGEGAGLYDNGHHTVVHLWPIGKDPFTDGRSLVWLGTPHMALPILQTGACGESTAIHLEPGETARLVVATTLPGYHIELLGDNASASSHVYHVALEEHPDHQRRSPLPHATLSEDSVAPVVAVDREWRSGSDTGPAAVYGLAWLHTDTDDPLPTGGFQVAGHMEWGFTGATAPAAEPGPVHHRGALGTTTDWATIFAAWTQGGHTEGHVTEHVQGGAYATSYDAGASFLSVPLGAMD